MSKLPDVERRQTAFRLYVRLRNISRVSKETGIPVATLHVWKKEEQWDTKLLDLQSALSGQVEVLKDAQNNLVHKDMLTELQLLEHLQVRISEALLTKLIQPVTWQDVIKGLEFLNKEKRLIMGQPTGRNENHDVIDITSMKEEDLDRHIDKFKHLIAPPDPASPAPAVEEAASIQNPEKSDA